MPKEVERNALADLLGTEVGAHRTDGSEVLKADDAGFGKNRRRLWTEVRNAGER